MSSIVVRVLCCDHGDCTEQICVGDTTLSRTRADAKLCGWSHVVRTKRSGVAPSLDFCPAHTADAERPWCVHCGGDDVALDEFRITCLRTTCGRVSLDERRSAP